MERVLQEARVLGPVEAGVETGREMALRSLARVENVSARAAALGFPMRGEHPAALWHARNAGPGWFVDESNDSFDCKRQGWNG
jgi:hypothetical protein